MIDSCNDLGLGDGSCGSENMTHCQLCCIQRSAVKIDDLIFRHNTSICLVVFASLPAMKVLRTKSGTFVYADTTMFTVLRFVCLRLCVFCVHFFMLLMCCIIVTRWPGPGGIKA